MDQNKVTTSHQSFKNINANSLPITKPTSLSTLIIWNISKAHQHNPELNVEEAIKEAQSRLERTSDVTNMHDILADKPYERHLACALLAWQQLGHQGADSLCRFVETTSEASKKETPCKLSSNTKFMDTEPIAKSLNNFNKRSISPDIHRTLGVSRYEEAIGFSNANSSAMGPVVMLPVETKLVMRLENTGRSGFPSSGSAQPRKPKPLETDTVKKIHQVCCFDTECTERLAALDATTDELRQRVKKLARREAERVELLERAEAAWKDLEMGFQRRLTLAVEKEEDIAKQISKMLEERTAYKNACTKLSQDLKDKSNKNEKERVRLNDIENILCDRACQRLKLSEESAKGDAEIANQATRAMQLEREHLFKEEQLRRTMTNLQSEVQSARILTSEAERATRAELAALRDQMSEISNNLLDEDARNEKIRAKLEELCKEKMEIIEDLDECKAQCVDHMQGKIEELCKKREVLGKLREKVMECRCKVPVDEAVEVKRTPSLAALCKCTPEDKILDSCSCTSMRSQLLSNLFADLFGGLQHELAGALTQMPCQLLKCLEDKHNWDRSSAVKSHLKNYFSRLLSGELDIAIATAIENYHAKWVGISCADAIKIKPGPENNTEYEGWEQRAIERRAQKLATELAEQLFQEREEELTKRARDIVESGPPPCDCDIKAKMPEGCNCVKKDSSIPSPTPDPETPIHELNQTPVYWHQKLHNVAKPTPELEHPKKGGGPPVQDTNEVVVVKPPKNNNGKGKQSVLQTKGNKGVRAVQQASANKHIPCPKSVLKGSAADAAPGTDIAPSCWQQAMYDVTQLRLQIENLKKESIKREDLKLMEDKITKIFRCSPENTVTTNSKMKDENIGKETVKKIKINKAVEHSPFINMDKTTKRKSFDQTSKTKSLLKRRIQKLQNRNNATYAVNMCLCSTKRYQQNEMTFKNKFERKALEHKTANDTVSKMASTLRSTKPINNSFLSQDISARTYMSYEHICPSNCVCFHNIPSNTSIDKLLESLAKWKENLNTSFAFKSSCNISKTDVKCLPNHNGCVSFKSKTSLKSYEFSKCKSSLYQPNAKCLGKNNPYSTEPMITTDSVYMGDVYLDKSIEDCNGANKSKNSTHKCIASVKCSCERILDDRKADDKAANDKKERVNKLTIVKTKQESHEKEIILVDNTTDTKTPNKDSEPKVNQIKDKTKKAHPIKIPDYEIKFLGVSLVDVNAPKEDKILLKNGNYLSSEHKLTDKINKYRENDANIKGKYQHRQMSSSVSKVKEFSKTNSFVTNKSNCFIQEEKKKSYPNKNNVMEQNEMLNDNIVRANFNPNPEENKRNYQLQVHKLYKNDNLDFKRAYRESEANEACNISKYKKCNQDTYLHVPCQEYVNNETSNNQAAYLKQSSNSNSSLKICYPSKTPNLQTNQCECRGKLEELKRFIMSNIATHANNKDAAIDIQNIKYFGNKDETCVCCNNDNYDDCTELEDNTFHLLEEYLRRKLSEFKTMSCIALCIPPEEEEKIYGIIIERVKRLISESTNRIVCKCSSKEAKSQGSWNRAYSLLQEYLKIKIKKIQCSCLLAEDNRDYLMPEVLEKISNLIEYDFQRLKNLCNCSNSHKSLMNMNGVPTEVNAAEDSLGKYSDVYLLSYKQKFSTFTHRDEHIKINSKQFSPLNYFKQCTMPQLLDDSTNNKKCCQNNNNRETSCTNLDENLRTYSLNKLKNQDSNFAMADNELQRKPILSFTVIDAISSLNNSNVKIKCEATISRQSKGVTKDSLYNCSIEEQNNMTKEQKASEFANIYKEKIIQHISANNMVEALNTNDYKLRHKYSLSSFNSSCDQKDSSPKEIRNKKNLQQLHSNQNTCEIPYIGCTINCTCDNLQGTHNCPKNMLNTTTTLKSISYILQNQLSKNNDLKITSEDIFKDHSLPVILKRSVASVLPVSATTCCKKIGKLVLKQSVTDNVVKFHAETNTTEDNTSVNTDCSVTEDPEWCECTSQIGSTKNFDADNLKRSIYFPTPIENIYEHNRNQAKMNKNCGLTTSGLQKHFCDCEKVPICHVKMFVENIETKLANANCTCDSLIAKVCPVHSTMC